MELRIGADAGSAATLRTAQLGASPTQASAIGAISRSAGLTGIGERIQNVVAIMEVFGQTTKIQKIRNELEAEFSAKLKEVNQEIEVIRQAEQGRVAAIEASVKAQIAERVAMQAKARALDAEKAKRIEMIRSQERLNALANENAKYGVISHKNTRDQAAIQARLLRSSGDKEGARRVIAEAKEQITLDSKRIERIDALSRKIKMLGTVREQVANRDDLSPNRLSDALSRERLDTRLPPLASDATRTAIAGAAAAEARSLRAAGDRQGARRAINDARSAIGYGGRSRSIEEIEAPSVRQATRDVAAASAREARRAGDRASARRIIGEAQDATGGRISRVSFDDLTKQISGLRQTLFKIQEARASSAGRVESSTAAAFDVLAGRRDAAVRDRLAGRGNIPVPGAITVSSQESDVAASTRAKRGELISQYLQRQEAIAAAERRGRLITRVGVTAGALGIGNFVAGGLNRAGASFTQSSAEIEQRRAAGETISAIEAGSMRTGAFLKEAPLVGEITKFFEGVTDAFVVGSAAATRAAEEANKKADMEKAAFDESKKARDTVGRESQRRVRDAQFSLAESRAGTQFEAGRIRAAATFDRAQGDSRDKARTINDEFDKMVEAAKKNRASAYVIQGIEANRAAALKDSAAVEAAARAEYNEAVRRINEEELKEREKNALIRGQRERDAAIAVTSARRNRDDAVRDARAASINDPRRDLDIGAAQRIQAETINARARRDASDIRSETDSTLGKLVIDDKNREKFEALSKERNDLLAKANRTQAEETRLQQVIAERRQAVQEGALDEEQRRDLQNVERRLGQGGLSPQETADLRKRQQELLDQGRRAARTADELDKVERERIAAINAQIPIEQERARREIERQKLDIPNRNIRDFAIDQYTRSLQISAGLGNKIAAQQAEEIRVRTEANRAREDINDKLRDDSLTKEQRSALESSKRIIDANEKAALESLQYRAELENLRAVSFTAKIGRNDFSAAEAQGAMRTNEATASGEMEIRKRELAIAKDQAKNVAAIYAEIKKIVTVIGGAGTSTPILPGPVT